VDTPPSSNRSDQDKPGSLRTTRATGDHELHLQDLPRAHRNRRRGDAGLGDAAEITATVVVDPGEKLQPVELETKAPSPVAHDDGIVYDARAREAELMALNAAPPPPPPSTSAPKPAPPKTAERREPTLAPPPAAAVASPVTAEVTIPHKTRPLGGGSTEGVRPPSGMARLSGQSLRFPIGAKLSPGEKVSIGGRSYEIKKERTFTSAFWLKGVALVVLVLLAAVGISHMVAGPRGGSITGVVIDRISSRIVPNAKITLADGRQANANVAGMYTFADLTPGLFKLTASADGYESQSGTVVRPASENAQLAFALLPLVIDTTAPVAFTSRGPSETAAVETEETAPVAYGNVTLNTDFEGYLVFVDAVLYGKDAKKLKRMPAGEHKVVLQLEGFEDYSTSVEVKARATATLTVSKNDLVPKVDPFKRAKGHFVEGKSLMDRGLWQQAIEAFDRGLEFDPENAEALQYRGWACFKSGNIDKARADFLAASQLHRNANRYLDAVACAGHLIDLDPTNPESYRRRAEFYIALTEYGKAIADYEQAVKLDKKSVVSQMGLGEVCFLAGDYHHAAKEFDKARKLASDPVDAYVRLLMALTRAGEDDQVRKKYKEFSGIATPERLQKLRDDPEWLRVLQIVDPTVRSQG